MKDKKKSRAGLIGSASRWANHEKVITKQIRVYDDDYSILFSLSASAGSIAAVVHYALVDSGYLDYTLRQAQARFGEKL